MLVSSTPTVPVDTATQWMEPGGTAGLASSTTSTIRTRREHGLLVDHGPDRRTMLVNGYEAFVDAADGSWALSSQRYKDDVVHPDGSRRIMAFRSVPWPRWTFDLGGGLLIDQELFVRKSSGLVVLWWRLRSLAGGVSLRVRPLVSGRDIDSLHYENQTFSFDSETLGAARIFRPYAGVPGIVAASNGSYEHDPQWYRGFLYEEELRAGRECEEDLGSPGVFRWDLSRSGAVWILGVDGHRTRALLADTPPNALAAAIREDERRHRGVAQHS